jgi:hypothetical protein
LCSELKRMNLQTENQKECCSRADIAAYIDGELSPRAELELERHFTVCASCKAEFNEQKKLLCALDMAFVGEKEFRLPENFTKTVIINAESNVKGLRCPKERARALFLCAGLFLLIILGLGSETETLVSTFAVFFEQIRAVGGFVGYLVYDAAIAVTTILRLIGKKFIFDSTFAFLGWGAFLITFLYLISRLMLRFSRSKI